ncbi:Adenosine kinase 2 [Linum grandiflorum]
MEHEGILLGMGNPLLDISAVVDQAFLTKYGIKVNDAILAQDKHLPMYDEMLSRYKVDYIAGGSTQNTIRVAQWMIQKPGSTSYIGCIGNDKFGEEMTKNAKQAGVNVCLTSLIYQLIYWVVCFHISLLGSIIRCIIVWTRLLQPEHVLSVFLMVRVEKARYYYIAGFFFTVSPESILLVAEHAAATNKIFLTNLSAPFICEFYNDVLEKVLVYADFVFGIGIEARMFAKVHGWETENVEEIAIRISQWAKASETRKRIVVITRGAEPAVVAEDGKVTLFPVTVLPKEKLVDTNGTGDAFVGGFVSQLVQGKGIEECVRAGTYAANVIIQR